MLPIRKIRWGLCLLQPSGLHTGWTGSSESEVRQMEASRGQDRLPGGPPTTLQERRCWPGRPAIFFLSRPAVAGVMKPVIQGPPFSDGEKCCGTPLSLHLGEGDDFGARELGVTWLASLCQTGWWWQIVYCSFSNPRTLSLLYSCPRSK